jgi:hypothetical protein
MTRNFEDDSGRRWKAWLASRDVFWPDPEDKKNADGSEAVLFVCFSDPSQPQRRISLPEGSFEGLSNDDLKTKFLAAEPDPAIR